MRRTVVVLVVSMLAVMGEARAQAVADQKLWLSGAAEIPLADAVRADLGGTLRAGADSGYDQFRIDTGLSFRASGYLGFAAGYSYMLRDGSPALDTADDTRHRLTGDVKLRARPGRLELSYRARLQLTTSEVDSTRLHLRNKVEVGYQASRRLTPFVAVEGIHLLDPVAEYRETRVYLGADVRLDKRFALTAYYLRQQETNVGRPEENNVLGLDLTYAVRRAGKDKGKGKGDRPVTTD